MSEETTAPESPSADLAPKEPSRLAILMEKFANWLASRRFGKVVTPIALLCIVIMLSLGGWQIQRLNWKNHVLLGAQEDFKKTPADLRLNPPGSAKAWEALHYKPVTLRGHWLTPFNAIKMGPRTYDGQAGYQLIIPLQLNDNQIVLINRGFVTDKIALLPPNKADVVIRGIAYLPETEKPRYLPENIPSRGVWVWPDMQAMGHEVGRDNIAPVMVYENRIDGKDEYPIGGQLPLPSANRHKEYALTWYGLALALTIIWLMASNPKASKPAGTLKAGKEKTPVDPVAQRGMYPEATD